MPTTLRRTFFLNRFRGLRLSRWRALARQRADLEQLDARLLRDIGVTPDDARHEARRLPWDAPDHWLG